MNGTNAAGEQVRNTQNFDFIQLARGFGERNRVGGDNFGDSGLFEALDGRARENGVSASGVDFGGTFTKEGVGGFDESAGGIDDVVDNESGAAANIANEIHDFGDVEIDAALVDDGQGGIQFFSESAGTFHTAGVG